MNLRLGCLLVLILLILPPAVASRFVPWWGVLLIVLGEAVLLVVAGPKLIGWGFKRFVLGMMGMKSRVLRGAHVEIHDVRRTDRPSAAQRFVDADETPPLAPTDGEPPEAAESDDLPAPHAAVDDDPSEADRVYWQIEFTLRPKSGESQMRYFDADDLMIVPFDARVSLDEDPTDGDNAGDAHQVFVQDGSAWHSPEGKLPGVEQRMRVIFRCPQTLRGRVKFRYYFETFGEATLPGNVR